MAEKITEFKFTDKLGHEHVLRSTHGLDMHVAEDGTIIAVTRTPGKVLTLAAAPGAWLAYRLEWAS